MRQLTIKSEYLRAADADNRCVPSIWPEPNGSDAQAGLAQPLSPDQCVARFWRPRASRPSRRQRPEGGHTRQRARCRIASPRRRWSRIGNVRVKRQVSYGHPSALRCGLSDRQASRLHRVMHCRHRREDQASQAQTCRQLVGIAGRLLVT
jgi:hypothetical protein